jgi:hypothetical protein
VPEPTTPVLAEPACRTCEDWGTVVIRYPDNTTAEHYCPMVDCEARAKAEALRTSCALPSGE